MLLTGAVVLAPLSGQLGLRKGSLSVVSETVVVRSSFAARSLRGHQPRKAERTSAGHPTEIRAAEEMWSCVGKTTFVLFCPVFLLVSFLFSSSLFAAWFREVSLGFSQQNEFREARQPEPLVLSAGWRSSPGKLDRLTELVLFCVCARACLLLGCWCHEISAALYVASSRSIYRPFHLVYKPYQIFVFFSPTCGLV